MGARPIKWVSPLPDPRGSADLRGPGSFEGSITETTVRVRPDWVWDPSETGLPIDFGTRTNFEYRGELVLDKGYLDGDNWILDRDMTIFTSDVPAPSDLPAFPTPLPNMTTDGTTLIEATTGGHSVQIEPRGTVEFADGIVAVSAEPGNWGGFLLRVLPKLADAARHDVPVLTYVSHSENQRRMAHLSGIRPRNLVPHRPWLRHRLQNVRIPLVPTSALWVSPSLKAVYLTLAERARVRHPDTTGLPRVYLSRRGSLGLTSTRTLVNEEQLITSLEEHGFHVLYPEDQPAPRIAAIVSQAKLIVTVGGAGMFNTVFAPEDAVVIDIEGQGTWLAGHTNLLVGAVRQWGLFYGYTVDPEDDRFHRPFAVDLPAFLRALDDVG